MDKRPSDQGHADKPRASYVPLSRETIEAWREHLLDIEQRPDESAEIDRLCDMAVNALLYAEEIERLRTRSAVARPIEAEVGKYPMRGDELLAILRGIADDEDKGVDKDRRRGAKWACFRCISAVESWLRCAQSATERTGE